LDTENVNSPIRIVATLWAERLRNHCPITSRARHLPFL